MRFLATSIPGCFEVQPIVLADKRGHFVKTMHKELFESEGLTIAFEEEYYSRSVKGVLRGMHFQMPPLDHVKYVYCTKGSVVDVVVDLRVGSPAFGKLQAFDLNDISCHGIYIPSGCAHGFYTNSDQAVMVYKVTTTYSMVHDTGIRWDSIGFPWPDDNPIISERDMSFVALQDFKSPFRYK